MALVRFDQDPELQPGAGLFHADDGTSFFAHDPDMASQLSPEKARRNRSDMAVQEGRVRELEYDIKTNGFYDPNADMPEDKDWQGPYDTGMDEGYEGVSSSGRGGDQRMALNDAEKVNAGLFGAPGQAPPAPPPQKADVQPAMNANAPPAGQPVMTWNEQPQSPALAEAEQVTQPIVDYVNAPVRVAATRGGVVPTTQQETREASGMPYDPNGPEAMARADASINVNMAGQRKAEMESARYQGEEAAYRAAMPKLQEEARIAEMRRDMQQRQYRRDREDHERAIEQSNKSAKSFDANRWFNDRGAIGSIGAAIAQAFGAGAAALTGGPNVVLQQINSYIDRDIMSQRAAIEADEKGANNALAQLNRQFGNLDQAEAALKIAQQKKVETMAGAYAASTKSQDVMAAYEQWVAGNNERRVAAEQQFQNAAYGKVSLQTAAKVIPASRGGVRNPTEPEKHQRLGTLEKFNTVAGGTYKTEQERQKAMGLDPEKADKEGGKLIENLDGSQVIAKTEPEATKIRDAFRLRTSAVHELNKIKKIAQDSASGGRVGEAKGRIKVLMKRALEQGNTMAGQGVFRTEDADYYTDTLFGAGGGVRTEVIDELTGMFDHEYQSFVDAQRGSAVNVAETGRGQRVKYTGKAGKNPTANVPVLRKIGGAK